MSVNHCGGVWMVPVSSPKCGIVQRSGSALRWSERQTENLPRTADPGPELPRQGSLEVPFEGFWIEHMGAVIPNLWRKFRCHCGDENAFQPQTQFPLRDWRGDHAQGKVWTLSFLPLSFNHIRLLIILWTSHRTYFNLSWRAGAIGRWGGGGLNTHTSCADFDRRFTFPTVMHTRMRWHTHRE